MSKSANRKKSSRRPSAKPRRTAEELEVEQTLAMIHEEQEEVGGCLDNESDYVLRCMIENKVALTQWNYLDIAYLGAKHSIEELGEEEIAELPSSFLAWPVRPGVKVN